MEKIGILTLLGYFNYGNRLQNYALKTFIESQGYYAETILYKQSKPSDNFKERLFQSIQQGRLMQSLVNKLVPNSKAKRQKKYLLLREVKFKEFSEHYLNESKLAENENQQLTNKQYGEIINKRYDSLFVGSDQVWNLQNNSTPDDYFLPFVDSKKRNSFAASFGFSEIPRKDLNEKYKVGLSNMNAISVREKSGQKIVSDLAHRDATLLLDPTMLLSKKDWLKIADKSREKPSSDYLLTYFLGNVTSEYKELIKEISNKYNLKVIRLNDVKFPSLFTASPSEFLDLVSNAEFVVTDSFHGTVFSTIFEVPFYVVDRVDGAINMSTRIVNILDNFSLQDRYLAHDKEINIEKALQIDFLKSKDVIKNNRIKSLDFLKNSLEVGDN